MKRSGIFSGKKNKDSIPFKIKWNKENTLLLEQSKNAVQNAEPEKAIKNLSIFENTLLQEEVAQLSARLSHHQSQYHKGILTFEEKEVSINRINDGIIHIISSLEQDLLTEKDYLKKVREYLTQRYQNRLDQKLAGRQPVNLRKLSSSDGTSATTSAAFISFGGEEIKRGIQNIFEEAYGRLLIIGSPGSGKTTLLLQLELSLLKSEKTSLPILLNLSTWKNNFVKFEDWLKKILPSEIGSDEVSAKKILDKHQLILLLDGFDEIPKEDRASCLKAIGSYGSDKNTRFAITSRKAEYIENQTDAPVNAQIEVGPLTLEQIEKELQRIGYDEPEAMPLLNAIKTDQLLREAILTPFYFNTIQLLFANGRRLRDLDFKGETVEARQEELKLKYVEMATQPIQNGNFSTSSIKHWMSFFAFEMNQHHLVTFELANLQYTWGEWSAKEIYFGHTLQKYVEGIPKELLGGIFFMFISIPFLVLPLFMLFVGSVIPSDKFYESVKDTLPVIKTKDKTAWSYPFFFSKIKEEIISGIIGGLIVGTLLYFVFEINLNWTIFFGILTTILISSYRGFIRTINESTSSFIQITEPYQRFTGSMQTLHLSFCQHLLLRYQCSKKNYLPLKLDVFLDEMAKNHLLESDGATWRFRHRILQDYFAEMWEVNSSKTQ